MDEQDDTRRRRKSAIEAESEEELLKKMQLLDQNPELNYFYTNIQYIQNDIEDNQIQLYTQKNIDIMVIGILNPSIKNTIFNYCQNTNCQQQNSCLDIAIKTIQTEKEKIIVKLWLNDIQTPVYQSVVDLYFEHIHVFLLLNNGKIDFCGMKEKIQGKQRVKIICEYMCSEDYLEIGGLNEMILDICRKCNCF